MKLSEMSTEKALETMTNMLPAISRVVSNERVAAFFESKESNGVKFMFDMALMLLRECKDDAIEIVSILCEKTAEQVKSQNILVTAKDIAGCYDKELADFFTSLRPTRQAS